MKILITNWLNFLGVFIAVFLYKIIDGLIDPENLRNIFQLVTEALILICLYGILFWSVFLISLIILDSILLIPNTKYIKIKLITEWVIICSPFVYWATIYVEVYNLFFVAIIAFLFTQLSRENLIAKTKL
jgi:hypothetical protein